MTKKNKMFFSLFAVGVVLFLFPGLLVAQGTSPVKVTSITLSPTTCDPGDIVTVTITLHNTSANPYNCGGMMAGISAFKATPYSVANRIWQAQQPVTSFAAGEQRNVTFTTKFTVPANLVELHFQARGPVCPPNEFPHQKNLVLRGTQPPDAEINLLVCITNGKIAPVGGKRDLHIWIKNNHFNEVKNISYSFYVEGKGTTTGIIPSLGSLKTKQITRNCSWNTAGTKKLSATVTLPESTKVWTVQGTHKVVLPGIAYGGSNQKVKCSDGTNRTESEVK